MQFYFALLLVTALTGALSGCAAWLKTPDSKWKIHQGPAECMEMCKGWDLEFAGMVGVGNQDRIGDGATACVCVPRSGENSEDRVGEFRAPQRLQTVAAAHAAAHAARIVIEIEIEQRRRSAASTIDTFPTWHIHKDGTGEWHHF